MTAVQKSVIFDIGNVFVEWDPRFLYEKLIPDADELDYFLKNIVTLDWHSEHDRGRSFAEGREILTKQFPKYAALIAEFEARWDETIGDQNLDVVRILETLVGQGTPVYALTNFSGEQWPHFVKKYAFTKHFKGVVVSGDEKLIKPDPAIYELTLSRYNLVPEHTYFTDDRLDNVKAAEALGIVGHQFVDAATLEADLKERGFL